MPISSYPMPANSGGNPFYNPNFNYWRGTPYPFLPGKPQADWLYGERHNEGPWTAYLASLGFGGLNTKGDWARSLYGRAQEGYEAAHGQNPVVNWQDYLHTLDLPKIYAGLGPDEKGLNDAQFGGPVRWQRRA
jgi:hypothetical protein